MAKRKNNLFKAVSDQLSSIDPISSNTISTILLSSDLLNEDEHTRALMIDEDEIERLKDQIRSLTTQNTELTEKLAVYIEEKTNEDISAYVNSLSAKISLLESEISTLKNENDKYLMKISELSFENAKLLTLNPNNDGIDVIARKLNAKQNNINNSLSKNVNCKKSNSVSYNQANGYSSWN